MGRRALTEWELNAVFPGSAVNDVDEMDREDAKKYRGIAARLNDLSPDRMDISFAVKEAARNMSKPLIGDWVKFSRISRYLVGRPRLVSLFAWQALTLTVTAPQGDDGEEAVTSDQPRSLIRKGNVHFR